MTVYLVTGAARGIGNGLVAFLLQRPSTTVIAAVRKLNPKGTEPLTSLKTASDSKLIIVEIDSADQSTPAAAIAQLHKDHPDVTTIDVVIANAGIANTYGLATSTSIDEYREHLEVNTIGPLVLFQATWPLLQKASKPQFVTISSGLASMGGMESLPMPAVAYGSTKAALNYVTKKIHHENEKLIAYPLSPGWVQTDMGNAGAAIVGMESAPVTLDQSVEGIMNRIDNATREQTSGTFQSFDDTKFDW